MCAILIVSTIVGQPAGATITEFSTNERQILGEAQADELYVVGPSGDRFYPDRLSASLKFVGTPANYWSPCGIFDKNNKMVRKFNRQAIKGLSGKTGNLLCGWHKNAKGSTKATGVGFRHIKAGHMSQWENQAVFLRANWREMADWATNEALNHSCKKGYFKSQGKAKYVAPYQIRDSRDRVIRRFAVYVVVGAKDQNVITSYPRDGRYSCSL